MLIVKFLVVLFSSIYEIPRLGITPSKSIVTKSGFSGAKNSELQNKFEALAPLYNVIKKVIAARTEKNMTRAELSKRADLQQPVLFVYWLLSKLI